MDSIQNTLREHGTATTKSQCTFVTIAGDKYMIPNTKKGEFLRSYCLALKNALVDYEQPDLPAKGEKLLGGLALGGILEKPVGESVPLVFDFVLRFKETPEESYSLLFMNKIIAIIQGVLRTRYDLYDLEDADSYLRCVVTQTQEGFVIPGTTPKTRVIAYQFRLYFPLFRVVTKTATSTLSEVIDALRKYNVLRLLEQSPIGDWDSIVRVFSEQPLPLYGSSESSAHPPCLFTYAVDDISEHLDDDASLENVDVIEGADAELFDIGDFSLVATKSIEEGLFDDFYDVEMLPVFLSHSFTAKVIKVISHNEPVSTPIQAISVTDFGSRHYKTDAEIALELTELIAPERFANKLRWIEIGKALHNTFKGNDRGVAAWKVATRFAYKRLKTNGFLTALLEYEHKQGNDDMTLDELIEMECDNEYSEFMYPGTITTKTLAWFACEDNPESYGIWHRNWSCPYRQDCYDTTHYSLAKALYCDLWMYYAVASHGKTKTVYEFSQHQWRRVDDGFTIRLEISEGFRQQFVQDRREICDKIAITNDEREKKQLEEQNKIVNKIIKDLRSRPFKSSVLSEVIDMLTITDFEGLLDKNGNLTGHPNGVTEVDTIDHTINFRPGKPEDYLSRATGAKMDLTLTWDHPRVKEYMKWMSEMFIDKGTCSFVHRLFASGFVAGNADKIAPFFTGDKNNGKSTLSNFLLKTWGKYAVKFPTTGLTKGYGDSGAANPAMVRISGPRWGLADEPDSNEKFCAGPFKRVFGNDIFYDRGLYSEGGDMESTCTVTVWSNKIPRFPNADDACRIRFCCIPCKTTYVTAKDAPETYEEQIKERVMPMNKTFQRTVDRLKTAALWVCYQMFPEWSRESLCQAVWPQEVVDATNEYWQENDVYSMYIDDRLDTNGASDDDFVTVTQVYKDFEAWYMMYNKSAGELPSRSDVKYHMVQHLSKTKNNKWYKVQFKRPLSEEGESEQPGGMPTKRPTTISPQGAQTRGGLKLPSTGVGAGPTTGGLSLRPPPTAMVTGTLDVSESGQIISSDLGPKGKPKPTYEKKDELALPTIEVI